MADQTAFIIGAGTAGGKVARDLAAAGVGVTIAESGEPGGTCVWRGCVPKKALYNAATTFRELRDVARFGIRVRDTALDWPTVMAWKRHAQMTYAGDQRASFASRGIELVSGRPRFVSPDEIQLDGTVYAPTYVVIATGSAPVKPPLPGIELADTSNEALDCPELPESLAILGGGYIAMEFAGIFASFGTTVTVIVRSDRVLPKFDPDGVALARSTLEGLGVRFLTSTSIASLGGAPGHVDLQLKDGERAFVLTAERVLAATGRRAALAGLDLDKAGMDLDAHGTPVVDTSLRTSNPRVWMAGDAAGGIQLTPVANFEGEHIAQSILSDSPQAIDLSSMPTACFTVPEIAQVGLTEAQADAGSVPHTVARSGFEYNAQAIITDQRAGFVKLTVAPDGRILGAAVAGPHASDLIYPFALAVRRGMTVEQVQATRAIHPSLGEALNSAAYDASAATRVAA
jgi:glutathione reductase (NADPH)